MRYLVEIITTKIVEIDASSEEDAIESVKNTLINTQQMKPCDPIDFKVVEEVKI